VDAVIEAWPVNVSTRFLNAPETALLMAIEYGHVHLVKHLSRKYNLAIERDILLKRVPRQNHEEMLRYLIEQKADINAPQGVHSDGVPPLIMACREQGQKALVRTLLELKADPNITATEMTAHSLLDLAMGQRSPDAYHLLERNRAVQTNPLISAAIGLTGDEGVEVMTMLLDRGAEPDRIKSHAGETPLSLALRRYQVKMVLLLLERGASVQHASAHSQFWEVPLRFAGSTGNTQLLESLVAAGMQIPAGNPVCRNPKVQSAIARGRSRFDTYITGLRTTIMETAEMPRPLANLIATYMITYFPPPEELPRAALPTLPPRPWDRTVYD